MLTNLKFGLIEWATEIKVRAERRAGELLAEMPKAKNRHSSSDSTLASLGIDGHQSSRWQKLAAVSEAQFEKAVAAAKEIAGEVTTAAMLRLNHNHRAQGTGENEWYTPKEYIEAARAALGKWAEHLQGILDPSRKAKVVNLRA